MTFYEANAARLSDHACVMMKVDPRGRGLFNGVSAWLAKTKACQGCLQRRLAHWPDNLDSLLGDQSLLVYLDLMKDCESCPTTICRQQLSGSRCHSDRIVRCRQMCAFCEHTSLRVSAPDSEEVFDFVAAVPCFADGTNFDR